MFFSDHNRRRFLTGAAATAAVAGLPRIAEAAPTFRRYEITDPKIPANIIPSYKRAIKVMLKLPATDPRNWYRQALIHVYDCPHRNWWFPPWHRAFIGYFERICRELSEDPKFTLPYWDWNKNSDVPKVMFQDEFTPWHQAYFKATKPFWSALNGPIAGIYKSATSAQKVQLAHRGFAIEAELKDELKSLLAEAISQPRVASKASPQLNPDLALGVTNDVVLKVLKLLHFAGAATGASAGSGFAGSAALHHSVYATGGLMENQPHDAIHGSVGGFMNRHFSPIDPLFYLHHGNVDRLWDLWTRRQVLLNRPTLPQAAELAAWSGEPFLFFVDAKGKPVINAKAGDYTSMKSFDYDYAPGFGEDLLKVKPSPGAPPPTLTVEAKVTTADLSAFATAQAIVDIPAGALRKLPDDAPPRTVIVTLDLSHADSGRLFNVLLGRAGGQSRVKIGTIFVFGQHTTGRSGFTLSLLDRTVAAIGAEGGRFEVRLAPLRRVQAAMPAHEMTDMDQGMNMNMADVRPARLAAVEFNL